VYVLIIKDFLPSKKKYNCIILILSNTPVRIAFGGGGTDVEPYSSENGGFVVNATINKFFMTRLDYNLENIIKIYRDDVLLYNLDITHDISVNSDLIKAILYYLSIKEGIDIIFHADPPKKAGLGASASLSCALIAGILKLQEKEINKNKVAEMAFQVEDKVLKNAGGRQDQYAAVHGGFNCLEFQGNSRVNIEKLTIPSSFKSELEKSLILYYTGQEHVSGDLVKDQIELYAKKKEKSKIYLDQLKEIAYTVKDSIISEDLESLGLHLQKDLDIKQKFNPRLMTEFMKSLNKGMIKRGAIGGRVCGAGGGGCMIWLIKEIDKSALIDYLSQQPGFLIDYKFVDKGLELKSL
jgi:D-glycero-alpha-D-manno-heptose-7-phosphate kinase